jgi:hypothetical protein
MSKAKRSKLNPTNVVTLLKRDHAEVKAAVMWSAPRPASMRSAVHSRDNRRAKGMAMLCACRQLITRGHARDPVED